MITGVGSVVQQCQGSGSMPYPHGFKMALTAPDIYILIPCSKAENGVERGRVISLMQLSLIREEIDFPKIPQQNLPCISLAKAGPPNSP